MRSDAARPERTDEEAASPPPRPDGWRISRTERDPREDGFYESLFALTNGFLGLRATVDFDAGGGTPGFFMAPLYGPGLAVPVELVNAIHPAYWSLAVDGLPMAARDLETVSFEQHLDLRQAIVELRLTVRDPAGRRFRLESRTLLPAPHRDLVLTLDRLTALDTPGRIAFGRGLDWGTGNGFLGGVQPALRLHHLEIEQAEADETGLVVCAANRGTPLYVAVATGCRATEGTARPRFEARRTVEDFVFEIAPGEDWRLTRLAVVAVGEDGEALVKCCRARREEVLDGDLETYLVEHRRTWKRRWRRGEVAIDDHQDERGVAGFRYGIFQLLQAPDREADAFNLPARGLTSEYHSGHFFFNTELFLVPYYSMTEPRVARALIRHRIAALDAAREHAVGSGFKGARYPEEADPCGRPAAPKQIVDPFSGKVVTEWSGVEVMHLTACVLYALYRYLEATGDRSFLRREALGLVVDGARYCADLMRWDDAVAGRGALRVMCFDEFHYHVDHHWATNYLARWALEWAADTLEAEQAEESTGGTLSDALDSLDCDAAEVARWRRVAAEVHLPPPRHDGVIEEFRGYFDLPDQWPRKLSDLHLPTLDPASQEQVERLEPLATRLVKQADVVLLMSLFPRSFDLGTMASNLDYYEPRTLHGSSLSLAPHALVAGRVHARESAHAHLRAAMRYNLDFVPRTDYRNGVHLAAYAGGWLALLEGLLGMDGDAETLRFRPCLPPALGRVRLHLRWRSRRLRLTAQGDALEVDYLDPRPGPIRIVCGVVHGVLDSRTQRLIFPPGRDDRPEIRSEDLERTEPIA